MADSNIYGLFCCPAFFPAAELSRGSADAMACSALLALYLRRLTRRGTAI